MSANITRRDLFAAAALSRGAGTINTAEEKIEIARHAHQMADEMLPEAERYEVVVQERDGFDAMRKLQIAEVVRCGDEINRLGNLASKMRDVVNAARAYVGKVGHDFEVRLIVEALNALDQHEAERAAGRKV